MVSRLEESITRLTERVVREHGAQTRLPIGTDRADPAACPGSERGVVFGPALYSLNALPGPIAAELERAVEQARAARPELAAAVVAARQHGAQVNELAELIGSKPKVQRLVHEHQAATKGAT